jgi:hypothetical protein
VTVTGFFPALLAGRCSAAHHCRLSLNRATSHHCSDETIMGLADLVPLHRAWHLHLQLTRRYGRNSGWCPNVFLPRSLAHTRSPSVAYTRPAEFAK